uniref:Secreted protein n=1 Tax=Accipiter nisus TaxID=211598 RepID=A0A8B9N295_9AVES
MIPPPLPRLRHLRACFLALQAANYCLSHLTQLLFCTHKPRQMSHPIFTTPTNQSRQTWKMQYSRPCRWSPRYHQL